MEGGRETERERERERAWRGKERKSDREILRKCGGGDTPVECKWIIKNLINRIGSALPPIYDVMIIHAEVVSRERIFIICLFKLFGRAPSAGRVPSRNCVIKFTVSYKSRFQARLLETRKLPTLYALTEARRSCHLFSHRNVFTVPANICIKLESEYRLNNFYLFVKSDATVLTKFISHS